MGPRIPVGAGCQPWTLRFATVSLVVFFFRWTLGMIREETPNDPQKYSKSNNRLVIHHLDVLMFWNGLLIDFSHLWTDHPISAKKPVECCVFTLWFEIIFVHILNSESPETWEDVAAIQTHRFRFNQWPATMPLIQHPKHSDPSQVAILRFLYRPC